MKFITDYGILGAGRAVVRRGNMDEGEDRAFLSIIFKWSQNLRFLIEALQFHERNYMRITIAIVERIVIDPNSFIMLPHPP